MRPGDVPRILTAVGAHTLGISVQQVRTELRRGRWQRLAAGVLLTRPERPTRNDWIRCGLVVAGRPSALSGWDAARLHGVGSPRPPSDQIVIVTAGGANRRVGPVRIRPSRRPVRVIATTAVDPELRWLPMVSASRAVADASLEYRYLAPVRAMVTAAVQRQLCTPDELVAELDAGPQNGSALLRRAVADVVGGARSIAEAEAADLLAAGPVPPFELNVPILDSNGRVLAVADVLWRELRAILEVDSEAHHFTLPDWKRTMRRHNMLTRLGYAVGHYPPEDIHARREAWVADVAVWLRARAAELGIPYAA
jgi:hypothetical protein